MSEANEGVARDRELRRFVIVAPLVPLRVGDEFAADAWPLHVTLVPPFSAPMAPPALSRIIETACNGIATLTVHATGKQFFGRRRDVPVVTLDLSPELLRLHVALLDALEPSIRQPFDAHHVRDGYRPHVTTRHASDIQPGSAVSLPTVASVDQHPDGDRHRRRVVSMTVLGG
ncbi:2'-5' RNA ligase family protein [Planctomonas sp. JC2975]|uniref:2'-5' RNA ligase family protein n=1 Tax=Planctomonas sp. JC2975 TaxID=2729626 RepID=UPI001473587D|nr:2'-5' RNA ligase family protein [Planctomonas sp. JC2975]NNC10437.1 2'-5' RNA ligase family protein [Planctomonas sp. JC2975]